MKLLGNICNIPNLFLSIGYHFLRLNSLPEHFFNIFLCDLVLSLITFISVTYHPDWVQVPVYLTLFQCYTLDFATPRDFVQLSHALVDQRNGQRHDSSTGALQSSLSISAMHPLLPPSLPHLRSSLLSSHPHLRSALLCLPRSPLEI